MIRRMKKILLALCLCFVCAGCNDVAQSTETLENVGINQYGAGYTNKVDESVEANEQVTELESETENGINDDPTDGQNVTDGSILEVHYIDVGQGDSILIRQGEYSMLIDAGNNDKGTTVWSYLLSQNVDSLDYAICTHPDADHIGGMDVVLYKLDCESVFMPACEHDTETYEDLIRTIGQREQKVIVPKRGEIYSLGEAEFQILTDTDKNYGDNKNDYSIAVRLSFGETSFLFTGDAEKEAEQDMMNNGLLLESDVYKAAHHGANWANTYEFLTAVNPTYAVISCGEGNSYGHPRAEVLNNLRSIGVKVFRTDEQGSIVAVSDGTDVTFNCSPSMTWKAGELTGSGEEAETGDSDVEADGNSDEIRQGQPGNSQIVQNSADQWKYVLNTSSKKIHYPHCGSVEQMSEKNKEYTNQSKEELTEQGYEPCGNCEP